MKDKGITLIALVVTVIVLLILAGISIGMLSGDNSIIKQAKNAKTQTNIAQEKEILQTASLAAIGKEEYGELNKDKVDDELDKMIGNDACKELYSHMSREIKARNINIEDIESLINKEALETEKVKYINKNYLNDDNQINSALSKNKSYYPLIYEQEYKSVIDGEVNTNGLKSSESPESLIERGDLGLKSGKTGANGSVQATSSIQPYQTFYRLFSSSVFRNVLGSIYSDILAPNNGNGDAGYYWVASRCTEFSTASLCYFELFNVSASYLGTADIYRSGTASATLESSLFPIVSLDYELIVLEGSNFKVNI